VLVIDDNPANTMLLHRLSEKSGLSDVVEIHDPLEVMPHSVGPGRARDRRRPRCPA
jgi:hypothetical protein